MMSHAAAVDTVAGRAGYVENRILALRDHQQRILSLVRVVEDVHQLSR